MGPNYPAHAFGYTLWFARKWSTSDVMKTAKFEELWIGWLPEELKGEGSLTRSVAVE